MLGTASHFNFLRQKVCSQFLTHSQHAKTYLADYESRNARLCSPLVHCFCFVDIQEETDEWSSSFMCRAQSVCLQTTIGNIKYAKNNKSGHSTTLYSIDSLLLRFLALVIVIAVLVFRILAANAEKSCLTLFMSRLLWLCRLFVSDFVHIFWANQFLLPLRRSIFAFVCTKIGRTKSTRRVGSSGTNICTLKMRAYHVVYALICSDFVTMACEKVWSIIFYTFCTIIFTLVKAFILIVLPFTNFASPNFHHFSGRII